MHLRAAARGLRARVDHSLIALVLMYISSLHARMKIFNVENIKLLDGMHEGLLILSNSTARSVMFCNNPAQKLLIRAIEYFEKQMQC